MTVNQTSLLIYIYFFLCCTACSVGKRHKKKKVSHLVLSIPRGFKDLTNSEKKSKSGAPETVQKKASCFSSLPVTSLSVHTSSSWLLLPGLSSSVPDWVSSAGRLRFTRRRGLVHIQKALDHNRDYYLGTA